MRRYGFCNGGEVRVLGNAAVRAPIILEEVITPLGEALGVQFLVLIRADVAGARRRPRRSVDARLEALGVDVVGEGLHVGETLVGVDHALRVARLAAERWVGGARLHRPAIINVHVLVAVIHHAAADHRVGGGAHDLVGHVALPHIPTVPAHVRRQGQRLAAHDLELALRLAELVGGPERHDVCAGLLDPALDLAGLGIHRQALRQMVHGKGHRAVARRRNREQERMPRMHAEDARAVDARRARRLGREDDGVFVRRADNGRARARDEQLGVGPIRMGEGDVAPATPRSAAAS